MGEAKRRGTFENRKQSAKVLNDSTLVRVQAVGDATSNDGNTLSKEDIIEILAPYTEPLTNELYQELLEKGFPKKDLDNLRLKGMQYNRARNSLINPYTTDLFTLIEYRQDEKSGKFQLFESELLFH